MNQTDYTAPSRQQLQFNISFWRREAFYYREAIDAFDALPWWRRLLKGGELHRLDLLIEKHHSEVMLHFYQLKLWTR